MARPQKLRRICCEPEFDSFSPNGVPQSESISLTLDEFEAIRLIDFEKLTHEQCAEQMQISRTTVTEIYEKARFKLADCLINGKSLCISGGKYRFCSGLEPCRQSCHRFGSTSNTIINKGENIMRIAVTYENGEIFQHFGHSAQFKLYDVTDGKVVSSQVVDTNGAGHGALAGFLTQNKVDILICGGIGGGAQTALAQAGIKLYAGNSGSADAAVDALLIGVLAQNTNATCDHHSHGEGHTCGEHGCGEHSCGGH